MYIAMRSSPSLKPPVPAIENSERVRHSFHFPITGSICLDSFASGEVAIHCWRSK